MHKCFLIRHAQTFYNQAQEECESLGIPLENADFRWDPSLADAELSPKGVLQCEKALELVHGLNIDKVFVSPLRRALQTCEILFSTHPLKPKIIVYLGLHEVLHNGHDVSVYKGEIFEKYSHFDWSLIENDVFAKKFITDQYKEILRGVSFEDAQRVLLQKMREINPEMLESRQELCERAQRTKLEWKKEVENFDIALVTHSSFLEQFTKKEFSDSGVWLNNCEVRECDLE